MTTSSEATAKPYAWLLKTEPDVYSFDDMLAEPKQTTPWDGVRNYQARNFMRDTMQVDDPILIYHSNCKPPGIVGLARVASAAYPDATQFVEDSKYFDPKATEDKPRWILVDVQAVRKFSVYVPLNTLKEDARLAEMPLVKRGNRLSVIPISKEQFEVVVELAGG